MKSQFAAIAATSLFAIGLTLAAPAAEPAVAQDKAALKELDRQLPGDLVNDPSRIDWQSYGADLEASAVVDESIPGGGAARRFEIIVQPSSSIPPEPMCR